MSKKHDVTDIDAIVYLNLVELCELIKPSYKKKKNPGIQQINCPSIAFS